MKKLLTVLLVLFFAGSASAGTYTPNLNLYLPAAGENNWASAVDNNFSVLDTDMVQTPTRMSILTASRRTGLVIPFYGYPLDPAGNMSVDVDNLTHLIRTYQNVPVIVISGVTVTGGANNTWSRIHEKWQGAGAVVVGYLDTDYTNIPLATVESQIGLMKTNFPELTGVFFDRVTNDNNTAHIAYYDSLYQYAHQEGYYPVITNPGSPEIEPYFTPPTSDITDIWEATDYPQDEDAGDYLLGADHGSYYTYKLHPTKSRAVIVYNQASLNISKIRQLQDYVGWIDITLDGTYDKLAAYLGQLFAYLSADNPDNGYPVQAGGQILASGIYNGGSGFVNGDSFEVVGSGNGSGAYGIVNAVAPGTGAVTAYTLVTQGLEYEVANNVGATALDGMGSGLALDITQVNNPVYNAVGTAIINGPSPITLDPYRGTVSAGRLALPPATFTNTPGCSSATVGDWATVRDSTVTAPGATIAGGGTNIVPAFCNGTAWTVQ